MSNDTENNHQTHTMNSRTFQATVKIFFWKHWKCYQCSWVKNLFMIIVPIAIAWFEIHVNSSSVKGAASNFQTLSEVNKNKILKFTDICYRSPSANFKAKTKENRFGFNVRHFCRKSI